MKALKYILYGLVIAAAAGLLAYQGLVTKELDSGNLTKGHSDHCRCSDRHAEAP